MAITFARPFDGRTFSPSHTTCSSHSDAPPPLLAGELHQAALLVQCEGDQLLDSRGHGMNFFDHFHKTKLPILHNCWALLQQLLQHIRMGAGTRAKCLFIIDRWLSPRLFALLPSHSARPRLTQKIAFSFIHSGGVSVRQQMKWKFTLLTPTHSS